MAVAHATEHENDNSIPPGGTPSVTDTEGFDRGTGTGEPTESVRHNLRLMKRADDGYNERDWPLFLYQLHREDVEVHQIGAPVTHGHAPHLRDMEMWAAGFPDMKVHNNAYDVQFPVCQAGVRHPQ